MDVCLEQFKNGCLSTDTSLHRNVVSHIVKRTQINISIRYNFTHSIS